MTKFAPLQSPTLNAEALQKAHARLEHIYSAVSTSWPGFIEREGQLDMIQSCLAVLLNAKADGDTNRDGANIGSFEAGTGTGKTVAYCLAAIVASEALGKAVVISTATVSLQEQLFFKDLPRLSSLIPELKYELLKGRGRYVCRSRLENAVAGDIQPDWLDEEDESMPAASHVAAHHAAPNISTQAVKWYGDLHRQLDSGKWDGEIDSLTEAYQESDWRLIQADAHACHAQRCQHFKECEFFKARQRCKGATLVVANHALVLSALTNDSQLIDARNTLFVFDEAHHLNSVATDQFSERIRIGQSRKHVKSFLTTLSKANALLPFSERSDLAPIQTSLHEVIEKCSAFEDWAFDSELVHPDAGAYRFTDGVIPDPLASECSHITGQLFSPLQLSATVRTALLTKDESLSPKEREARATAANNLSKATARVSMIYRVFKGWATHDKVPLAKWITLDESGSNADAWFCTCPLTGAPILAKDLWREVSAAVCTSATLRACENFDFFDRLSGLRQFPKRTVGVMNSPFDYARQGELRLSPLRQSPKSKDFSSELCRMLPSIMAGHTKGQLVLFTSRRQMEACYQALDVAVRSNVLMQGSQSRQTLLKAHTDRIGRGGSSILFGLQSLGEGLDLPGDLCQHVVIDKLPFSPPNTPVEEALAEWLTAQGRDAFNELTVPKAAMRLAQWVGRGVRSVSDYAVITVCDNRLGTTGYGRKMLAGLPAFPVRAAVG